VRCLITGADGFLGANLCRLLLAAGHEVTGAALNRHNHTSLDALGMIIRLEYGDVTDAAYVERLVNAYEAEVIYHLAAVSIVRVAERDPGRAIRTNVLGTLNVCQAGQRAGAQVIVASSDKAYGDNAGERYREDTPLRPTGAYEVSKACADHVARLYGAIVVRAANLYGPADLNWSRLVPNSCRLVLSGQAPHVYGNSATYQREWLHVEDACRAYVCLAEKGRPGEAYNVGSGETESPLYIARQLSSIANAPAPALKEAATFYEIPTQELDCQKMYRLGWSAIWTLGEGLRQTLRWYERQTKGAVGCAC
jgi:CDP-glucose 4,6-dehydratase